jgi:hypothetical protein
MSVVNHTTFDTKENGRHLRHTVVGVGGGVEFDAVALLRTDVFKVASPGDQIDPDELTAIATGDLEQWWWD